jgi:drug/metabolite transporter (DMT)-like permease
MTNATIDKGTLGSSTLWTYLMVISAGWGSSFLFTRLIGNAVPPFAYAATRGFVAMAALLIWLAVWAPTVSGWRERLGNRMTLRHMIVLGTTNGWLANVLVVVAVRHIDTGVVAMVQAGVPLMVAVMAHFIFDEERLEARQLVGLTAGMTGIVLIVGPLAAAGRRELLIGVAAMLLTTLLYAYGTVYARSIATKDPTTLACGQQAFGALVATMISIAIEAPALSAQPMQIWVYFAILGVVCSAVPTVLYLGLLARTTSVKSSLVAYLQPVWATLFGLVILGERVRPLALFGAALVIVGISVGSRHRSR